MIEKTIKDIFYDDNKLNNNKMREKWVKKHQPVLYEEINHYIKNIHLHKYSQKIYHYVYKIDNLPKCVFCNKSHDRFISFEKGYNKFCSKSCASKYSSKKGQKNRKENTFKKYGVEHTTHLKSVKEKMKKTNLKRYGVEYASQNLSIQEKQKETINKKYGCDYPLQHNQSIKKMQNTILAKYNVSNISQNTEIIKKREKTNLERYGNKWSIASKEIKNKIRKQLINERLDKLKKQYKQLDILSLNNDFDITIHCNKCKENYVMNSNLLNLRINRYNIESCIYCNPLNDFRSSYEKELEKTLKEKNINVIINTRKIISPYEIDIFLPDFNIGIEINGLYWHNELYKNKNYHLNKTKTANKNNIHLIHIWEDEWLYKKDIVLSKLFNLLNLNSKKIYARKTYFKEIDSKITKKFLDENHLQGYIPSSYRYGLFYDEEMVSIMTFSKSRKLLGSKYDSIELLRFCNKKYTNVIGSASKLFKNSIKINNFKNVISYAKRDWSLIDNIYDKLNFQFEKYTTPGYYWTKQTKRYHRYKFRKDILIKQGYDKNKTEVEIMNSRDYYRIYDSGNLKYTYNKKIES